MKSTGTALTSSIFRPLKYEKRNILITVKAYPVPSISYGETVCCAGIDLKSNEWIRLWPVPYRDLELQKRFKKYDVVEVSCGKAAADKRPESYKIVPESIKIIDRISSNDKWRRRKQLVFAMPIKSQCFIECESREKDTSLGIVKPEQIKFSYKKRPASSPEERRACYAQYGLFIPKKDPVEEIPFIFYYEFKCFSMPACPGHKLPILDWEIGQAYRKFREKSKDQTETLKKVEMKWLDISNSAKKDVYFYVGNQLRFRDQFAVLGVFWPPL